MIGIVDLSFVDCSSNNPIPDIAAYARSGRKHIARKVTEGTGYHWVQGDTVHTRAHAAGLKVGAYGWVRPDQNALEQADFFVNTVAPLLKPGDWLAADFEATYQAVDPVDSGRARQLDWWCNRVHSRLPAYPLYVYTGNWYLEGKPACQAVVRKWPVWISNYDNVTVLPNPYNLRYAIRQFTDRATVAGFSAPVDQSYWITPPQPPGGLVMDAEVKAAFADLTARIDKVDADLRWFMQGTDGTPHKAEQTIAHVTQGMPYASGKGFKWPSLFRK